MISPPSGNLPAPPIGGFRARVPGPRPLAHQIGRRVFCLGCLPPTGAQRLADEGAEVGDVHPWTVDLWPGEKDLRCDVCGDVLLQAPADEDDDEEE
ncbi:hypothetical protein ACFOWE_17980 [Planomonospora corallina]|uniref:Uncharacterized protein n=1 Tax=Planomonospora corallina TaxID=1806052 RepID=A0ABV8I800_9ACTN